MSVAKSGVTIVASLALLASTLIAVGGVNQAAIDDGSVRFTAAGDYGTNSDAQAVLTSIGSIDPDLHVALGDLSYGVTGQEQAWCDLVTARVGAGFPFQLLAGNHESNGQNGNINDFSACLPNQLPGAVGTYGRQYFVDVPQASPLVRFILISPGTTFPDGHWSYDTGTARYAWTASAIDGARAAGIPWVVVGMHKPCFSLGDYLCEPGADITNLLISKKVDLVLNGHEHLYQRTHQLATSAGCPALVPGTVDPDCIADSDTTMVKGGGTVFATVGTGGRPLRAVSTSDAEIGYFDAWSGLEANPTFGLLDVTATATEMTASFARASGGTFTDSFTFGPAGTQNNAPLASFTVDCALLACEFDASASTDSDGTITGFAWDFGDGAIGSGVTTEHSYGSSGDRTVTLTVTDDDGATATTTRTASPTAPGTTQLAADAFERTVAGGWGTADTGGAWTLSAPATAYSVNGGLGRISVPAGGTRNTYLTGVSSSSTVLTATVSTDKVPTGSGLYLTLFARRVPGVGAYGTEIRFRSDGTVTVQPTRANSTGGGVVDLQSAVRIPGTISAGQQLAVAIEVSGLNPTTVRAKAWPAGTPEPADWQRSATDTTAGLQAVGGLATIEYLSGSATNAPIQVSFDNLVARAP